MKLAANNVHDVFTYCLFKEQESTENMVKAEGILRDFGFHPTRLKEREDDIISMLSYLPDSFHEEKGGGWSFLNACNDKDGKQWANLHTTMEQLFVLGLAIGKVKNLIPKEMWKNLYGGMPYYVVLK
jgi:hypothetical protein